MLCGYALAGGLIHAALLFAEIWCNQAERIVAQRLQDYERCLFCANPHMAYRDFTQLASGMV